MNTYYVYILRDPRRNDEPFYVGKGKGHRARVHLGKGKKTDNPWKTAKIKKIREAGLEPIIQYYATDLTEDAAYDLEAELIKKLGRAKIDESGILTNMCIDARPPPYPTGQPMREDIRKKISDGQRGEKNHQYGHHWSDAEKQLRRDYNKANGIKPPVRSGPMSEAQKAAIGAGNKGKKRTPEQSAHLSEIRRGQQRGTYSEEHRAAIRRALGTNEYPDDLTGLTFGRWTVLSRAPDRRDTGLRGAHAEYWLCICGETQKEICRRNLIRAQKKMLAQQQQNTTIGEIV